VGKALTPTALAETIGEALREIDKNKYLETAAFIDTRHTDKAAVPGSAANSLLVRLSNSVTAEDAAKVAALAIQKLDSQPLFAELTTFSSSVATDTQFAAILAMAIAMIAITIYLWFRFSGMTFGIAATIALVHDVLFTLGAVAVGGYLSQNALGRSLMLIDFKINLTMVAAFLTIIGYSLNDTIVVFDRIREVRGKNPKITWEMVNISLNQTLSRTLLTSVTTIITSTILYFFGGEGLRGFAYSLTLGILVGTYSSIYIASPALVWLMNRQAPEPPAKPAGLPAGATAR
jgi:SecD/SecF fusion protein